MFTQLFLTLTLAAQDEGAELVPSFDGDFVELSAESTDPNKAHDSANDFAHIVGEKLQKERTRKKVLDPHVEIHVFRRDGRLIYKLVWSCRLVDAKPKDADCYFDRRGTMLSGKTLQVAQKSLEIREAREGKLLKARKSFVAQYGNSHSPFHFSTMSCSGSASEGAFWCIQERFLTAKAEQCR